ncbi:hypothetical protein BGZ51_005479 [Haplosporangium sp. Z 767]|nr:hypothetical protein BGZ51_005479 [Haplosporangium sp. Z 767]
MISKQKPDSTHSQDEEKDEAVSLQASILGLNLDPTSSATDSGGEGEDEDENPLSTDELLSHLAWVEAGATATAGASATASQSDIVKQPCNSYMLYRKQVLENKRAIYRSQNLSSAKISEDIGEMWRNEPEEVKLIYETKADLERLAFIRAFPDFKYRKSKKALKGQKTPQAAPAPASAPAPIPAPTSAPAPGPPTDV